MFFPAEVGIHQVAEWAPAAIVLLDWALEFPGQSGDLHKPG